MQIVIKAMEWQHLQFEFEFEFELEWEYKIWFTTEGFIKNNRRGAGMAECGNKQIIENVETI